LHLQQSPNHGTALPSPADWPKCPLPTYSSACDTLIHNNNYHTPHGNNKNQKISTTSLHYSTPDSCLISNGDQFSHLTPNPNTVSHFHTHFLQPARGHWLDFSTAVTPPTTLMPTNGNISPDHQTLSNDSQDSFSHTIPSKEQSSTAPEPSVAGSPNPVPIANPTIISSSILWPAASTNSTSPIALPACLNSDGTCHLSTANLFCERL